MLGPFVVFQQVDDIEHILVNACFLHWWGVEIRLDSPPLIPEVSRFLRFLKRCNTTANLSALFDDVISGWICAISLAAFLYSHRAAAT